MSSGSQTESKYISLKRDIHITLPCLTFFFVHSFLSIIVFLFYLVSLFTIRTLAYKNLKESKVQFFKMMFLLDSQLKFDVGF